MWKLVDLRVFIIFTAALVTSCTGRYDERDAYDDMFEEGDIELRFGFYDNEGAVFIYHDGVWGGICDDRWTRANRRVVCRELGYEDVEMRVSYDIHSGWIWLKGVRCGGEEERLIDCDLSEWGHADCPSGQYAGVVCEHYTDWSDQYGNNYPFDEGEGMPFFFFIIFAVVSLGVVGGILFKLKRMLDRNQSRASTTPQSDEADMQQTGEAPELDSQGPPLGGDAVPLHDGGARTQPPNLLAYPVVAAPDQYGAPPPPPPSRLWRGDQDPPPVVFAPSGGVDSALLNHVPPPSSQFVRPPPPPSYQPPTSSGPLPGTVPPHSAPHPRADDAEPPPPSYTEATK